MKTIQTLTPNQKFYFADAWHKFVKAVPYYNNFEVTVTDCFGEYTYTLYIKADEKFLAF